MIKNMKNLITFGILTFAFFGISSIANAQVYQQTFGGGMPTSRYGFIDTSSYQYSNYYDDNYNDQEYYQSRNTGYIPVRNQNDTVYGSDPLAPKQAVVLSSNSGTNTKTVANNTVKNTTTTKSSNNTTSTNKAVSSNSNSSADTSTVSGSSYDANNNGNSVVALSAYGSDRFLPDTVFEWILVTLLILIVIVLARLIGKKNHNHEAPHTH